ncbi:MAG TPA: hypothetical protein V6D14_23890 [Coleofasciculaceae cyanobacterium]|jgi:hypothetical protein
MTGKVIDSSATGLLILILPFAFLIVLLFKAWPLLLALFIISISLKIWQHYQWKQWSKQVNPFFNQLIKENQGCLTALDLSMKANLSGSAAQRYLDKKAEEFGAQRQVYEDKGTVYYFLTASALGSIFDQSEPPLELESESFASQASKFIEPLTQEPNASESESSTSDFVEPLEPSAEKELSLSESATAEMVEALEAMPQSEQEHGSSLDEKEDLWADSPEKEQKASQSLIQAELAKRLDVHSSTVGKRKSDPDFAEWSQSRDPEGIAWEYSSDTKEFFPVEKNPKLEQ